MYELLPAGESAARIERLQAVLREEGAEGLLVSQSTDLYYLTGTMQAGYAFVPAEGEPALYIRRSLERARRESRIRTVELGSFRMFAATLEADFPVLSKGESVCVAAPLDALPAQTYVKLTELFASIGVRITDGSSVMRRLRMTKSPWELERISSAAAAAAEALEESLNGLREGVTELEWMARFEYEIRRRGHIGVMRMRAYNMEVLTGMVGSGAAAAEPTLFDGPAGGRGLGPAVPQSVSRKPFARNEPILIDIGCCIDGYVIDQTRTAVIGELPEKLAAAYDTAERIMRRAQELLVPGTTAEALYAETLRMAEAAGLADHFMGFGADRVRFVGHGIGLEVDEWPVLAQGFDIQLAPGMVLAVEPKFTFPGLGVVGIENCYAVTAGRPLTLTRSPEELIVVPLMN
ncbi:Xaa-Pro peptidase family protein [uncultured Paenibacillus sp.]|uniref:M24 family metallopeptidase n=1 Tax=uncultured Paenibacillus sp. TaxID=227322 RepID=UPI0028D810E2|nr:Xaa-Pro peptidase family protein [uncultured Paenibacillus sp.]